MLPQEIMKHKIVIVEDEGLIAADLQGRLTSAGYAVTGIADSGSRAFEVIRKTAPDLVLMDIRIKGDTDGIHVADQVRREMNVPVVYLTAYEDPETLARAAATQAFGYIKKPIASASLRGAIEMAISKHRCEKELRAERDWAAASFRAVPYAVLVTDQSGRIRYLNSQAEGLTGWNAKEALGRSSSEVLRLFYRQTGKSLEDFAPAAMLHGETIPFPAGIWLNGGKARRYAVEGSVAPRWRDGHVEGAVIALADNTLGQFEEEQARQDLKQKALLRLADGIVRHLPEAKLLAEDSARLLDGLPRDSPLRESVEAIGRAAMDALSVTYRLKALLEPPAIHTARVSVREILAGIESAWKTLPAAFALKLYTRQLSGDGGWARADAWQLTRSLIKLLLHACRRKTAASEITLELAGAEHEQMSHSVLIRITYTSADEDATSIERIFEPCWSDESDDLPIAYLAVKKMGGILTARMEQNSSVVFDTYLLRVQAAAAGARSPAPGKAMVLLMEPNQEVRRILHVHFERHGYNLMEAANSEEGLLLAELYEGTIPLIIANPGGYDQDREDLASKLAKARPSSTVRVLAGYYEKRQAASGHGSETGETRHLTKWDLLEWVNDAFAAAETNDRPAELGLPS
jgi:AmiR/NasT family two-component response regulator